MNISLSSNLDDAQAVPYFLWDEPVTVAEFVRRLRSASAAEQTRLLAKLLREARDTDVWKFTTPEEVERRWPKLSPRLGRRRGFWEFLLGRWRQEGLIGKQHSLIQTAPDFRRLLVQREGEAIVVDLVRERVWQTTPEKPVINGVRVDPPEEILANKLCALLSRSEIRDLVDVRALESAGYRIEAALAAAALKDTGLTPAQLAWVLSQIEMGEDLQPPGGVSVEELRGYVAALIARLTRLAFPG